MDRLLVKLLQRYRPRVGWPVFTLALAAALCPALAAEDSKLELPTGIFIWAALLGLPLGLWFGRARPQKPATMVRAPRHAVRLALQLAIALGLGALLLVAAGKALPPLGLIAQDLAAFMAWVGALLRRAAGWSEQPAGRTWAYLAATLPRFWQALLDSPNTGERGATLIVAAGGVTTTWLGTVTLGWALARRRNLFGWGLPLLAALALTAILGAGTGIALVGGLGLLLLLTIGVAFEQRRRAWDRSHTDYSEELRIDILGWGGGAVAAALAIALLLPTSIDNPLTKLLWRDVELPSGIAVLERTIPRPPPPRVDVGLSTLPALDLGQSLEESPPDQVILRIALDAPLKPSPWPRYWRARVFNVYGGRGWTTDARVGAFGATAPVAGAVPDTIVQEIADLRQDRTILIGLPDIFALDVGAQAEQLSDGGLAALTNRDQPARYRVASRPQELAPPPPPEAPQPDLRAYLALPPNYPPRVADLARSVVGAGKPPYDQALALETYLRELPYSYRVQPIPNRGDAVEQFLFDMRQGYCTYYASAMAVMARTLGIPARVAIGYATGTYDQASGAYLVRQADAHAWPELYIDGRWLPFEPTPVRTLPARTVSQDTPAPTIQAPAEQPAPRGGPLIWAGVLVAIALLTFLGWRRRRPRRPRALAVEVQQQLEQAGARAGVPWPSGATLHEYGALLEPHAGDQTDALHEVVGLVARARYSGQPLRDDQEGRLRRAADQLLARLGRRRAR